MVHSEHFPAPPEVAKRPSRPEHSSPTQTEPIELSDPGASVGRGLQHGVEVEGKLKETDLAVYSAESSWALKHLMERQQTEVDPE
jgi:hypothetical protein